MSGPAESGSGSSGSGSSSGDSGSGSSAEDAARWLVVNGRRWRRTDPALPESVAARLRSALGSARSGVRQARRANDDEALADARRRVGLAKTGLGERGPAWWTRPVAERLAQADDALRALDPPPPPPSVQSLGN